MTRRLQIAAIIAALGLAGCGGGHEPAAEASAPVRGERFTVREAVVGDYKPVAAQVATLDMGEARARIGGTLLRLDVREGDYVRKGQVIGLVADQRIYYETSAFEAQVAAAEAQALRADADLKRVRTLFEKGIYARARLDQAEAEARAARGQLNAARAQRAASAESGAQGAIVAPAAGRVLKADVPAGSVVSPGQSVATVTAGRPLLRLEIPEAQARLIRVGEVVRIDPRDLPGGPASAPVTQVYPAVEGGRVTVDVALPAVADDLIGQRVRVLVKAGERTALVAPRRFVATRYGIDYVRVVGRDGRAMEVAVQLAHAPAGEPEVEVLSGLAAGDVLVAPVPAPRGARP